MILDDSLDLSIPGATPPWQDLSGNAAQPTNYLDVGAVARTPAMTLIVMVSSIAGTTPDLTVGVYADTGPDFATERELESRYVATANLVTGMYLVAVPPQLGEFRYYRAKFAMGGNAPTAKVKVWLVPASLVSVDRPLAGAFIL